MLLGTRDVVLQVTRNLLFCMDVLSRNAMQVTREVISDLAASKYQMVEWRSVLDARPGAYRGSPIRPLVFGAVAVRSLPHMGYITT